MVRATRLRPATTSWPTTMPAVWMVAKPGPISAAGWISAPPTRTAWAWSHRARGPQPSVPAPRRGPEEDAHLQPWDRAGGARGRVPIPATGSYPTRRSCAGGPRSVPTRRPGRRASDRRSGAPSAGMGERSSTPCHQIDSFWPDLKPSLATRQLGVTVAAIRLGAGRSSRDRRSRWTTSRHHRLGKLRGHCGRSEHAQRTRCGWS